MGRMDCAEAILFDRIGFLGLDGLSCDLQRSHPQPLSSEEVLRLNLVISFHM